MNFLNLFCFLADHVDYVDYLVCYFTLTLVYLFSLIPVERLFPPIDQLE